MPDDVNARGLPSGQSNAATMAQRLNRVAGEFLLVDAETALTLLDIAEMSQNPLTAQNDFDRASEALATINHFLDRLNLESDLRAEVESARDQLRERVKSMWAQFRS